MPDKTTPQGRPSDADRKAQKRAEALRQNLARRKDQARQRAADTETDATKKEGPKEK